MPGEGFPALRDADMQEALNSHAAELPEEDPEHLAALCEPEDDYGNVMTRTVVRMSVMCQVS